MGQDANVLFIGAGGFIGHHLTRYLVAKGYFVRGVDVKFPQYELSPAAEFRILDLRRWGELPGGDQGHGPRLPPSRQHGRDRLHRD